jgi:hypothetical protein
MARRSGIGNLGLAESTPTNTEITINQKHGHHSLQFMAWWFFNHEELNPNACPLARKKDGSSFYRSIFDNFAMRGYGLIT